MSDNENEEILTEEMLWDRIPEVDGEERQVIPRGIAGVIVIADQLGLLADVLHQLAGYAGILTGYRSYGTEYRRRARRKVA